MPGLGVARDEIDDAAVGGFGAAQLTIRGPLDPDAEPRAARRASPCGPRRLRGSRCNDVGRQQRQRDVREEQVPRSPLAAPVVWRGQQHEHASSTIARPPERSLFPIRRVARRDDSDDSGRSTLQKLLVRSGPAPSSSRTGAASLSASSSRSASQRSPIERRIGRDVAGHRTTRNGAACRSSGSRATPRRPARGQRPPGRPVDQRPRGHSTAAQKQAASGRSRIAVPNRSPDANARRHGVPPGRRRAASSSSAAPGRRQRRAPARAPRTRDRRRGTACRGPPQRRPAQDSRRGSSTTAEPGACRRAWR